MEIFPKLETAPFWLIRAKSAGANHGGGAVGVPIRTFGNGIPLCLRTGKGDGFQVTANVERIITNARDAARLVNQREWFRGKDGEYTAARLDQESGSYMILPLRFRTAAGPQTHGTYIWGEFENLQAVEDRLIDGPYIHHFIEMEGDYTKEIAEFCKYVPNLKLDCSLKG